MKSLAKIVALGAVLAASSSFALADTVSTLSAAGGNTFTSSTITFTGPFLSTGDTGIFSGLNGGTTTFVSGPLNYTTGGPFPGTYVFSVANAGETASFYVTSDQYALGSYVVPNTGGTDLALEVNGAGYFTGNFFSGEIPGSFFITSQGEPSPNGDSVQVTFSGTGTAVTGTAVTPEPNSLVLLGTGLVGAAGMLSMRRRNASDLA